MRAGGRQKPIDADFEVIGGPYRVGDEHRVHKRWFFTGHYDERGVPLWYRPPRFTAWQIILIAAFVLLGVPLIAGLAYNYATFGDWRETSPAVASSQPPQTPPR